MTAPACVGHPDPDLWFVTIGSHRQRAAAICRTCPVRESCEAGARARGEEYGIWNAHDAAMGWLEVEAPPEDVMVVAEARIRPTVASVHGSRGRYANGCRCELCTAANTAYVRGYRDHGPVTTRETIEQFEQMTIGA